MRWLWIKLRKLKDFKIVKEKVLRAHRQIGVFLKANGLDYQLRDELQNPEMKQRLIDLLPISKKNCDDFELNCFYQIYKRRLNA